MPRRAPSASPRAAATLRWTRFCGMIAAPGEVTRGARLPRSCPVPQPSPHIAGRAGFAWPSQARLLGRLDTLMSADEGQLTIVGLLLLAPGGALGRVELAVVIGVDAVETVAEQAVALPRRHRCEPIVITVRPCKHARLIGTEPRLRQTLGQPGRVPGNVV